MAFKCDFHIHTKYLGCANETMELDAIARRCREVGAECIGITDHLNTADRLELHRPILADIHALETDLPVYFGVELNFTGADEGFVFNDDIKADYGFQFAIGGIHSTYLDEYDLTKIIETQHRHHLLTCRDELVDVLVHPWWFSGGEFRNKGFPAFESVRVVPDPPRPAGRAPLAAGGRAPGQGLACLSHGPLRVHAVSTFAGDDSLAPEFVIPARENSCGKISNTLGWFAV